MPVLMLVQVLVVGLGCLCVCWWLVPVQTVTAVVMTAIFRSHIG